MPKYAMSPVSDALDVEEMDSKKGWLVVFAAFWGLLLSVGVLVVYSYGVLISAMSAEFGWGALEASTLFAAFSFSSTAGGILWGMFADRRGGRLTVLISSALLAGCFFALSLLPGNLLVMHLLFAAIGFLGSGTLPPIFSSIVVGWFDRHRGLALGATMAGVGVGAAILPPLTALMTAEFGWRQAISVLGLAVIVLMIPVAALLLREHRHAREMRTKRSGGRREAIRLAFNQRNGWLLALFALLTGGILVTSVTMFVPILQDRGETVANAALYQSILGASLIGGRFFIGLLIDRIFAPYVMLTVLFVTTAGFFILYFASTPLAYLLAAVGIGLAVGAEVDFLGFMVSRYFPREAFATIFAVMFAMYSLGASSVPLGFGWLAETTGGFGLGIMLFGVLMFGLALMMLLLPGYRGYQRNTV
ncbi:MFS transporter [Aurantiacibacter poecillastricola]|uniref:MFS transporter n=1 Tax=Aurantiacibacter poecillastricola TaxID=3064385 RepID=UPI00273DB2F8|nr:MFS transporter [Aurantiacibacter sp. 219JJ12-13]MDP5263616.1 MFS transporter [Aurantiacibacter sp. 219JJ12-13]